jgi:hypothetical protein
MGCSRVIESSDDETVPSVTLALANLSRSERATLYHRAQEAHTGVDLLVGANGYAQALAPA